MKNESFENRKKRELEFLERLVEVADFATTVADEIIEMALDQLEHYNEKKLDKESTQLKTRLKNQAPKWPSCL